MIRRQPRSTRTDTPFPYTTLFRSVGAGNPRAPIAAKSYQMPRDGNVIGSGAGRKVRGSEAAGCACRVNHSRRQAAPGRHRQARKSEEHTSELQSLMRISYAVFCWKKKKTLNTCNTETTSKY